nr:toprim domain-containing protein [Tessaracoccus sp. OS52]
MWRTQQLTTAPEDPELEPPPHPDELPPADLHLIDWDAAPDLDAELKHAAQRREITEPDLTETRLQQAFEAADRWEATQHAPQRLVHVNDLTATFYANQLPDSWSQRHLVERFGTDLVGDLRFLPGYAPAGWSILVNHLRGQGISEEEMLTAGVAARTRDGRLIDKFRDRLMFPIIANNTILGFVGRRNPDRTQEQAGPKYLNTAITPLYCKRDVLFGQDQLAPDAVPVIVEGPMDAMAVTLAGAGRFVGVAPLGTALTAEQAVVLAGGSTPVIATDPDAAGRIAAENAFWLLAAHRFDPGRALLPPGSDPAELLQTRGPRALLRALETARSQGEVMADERLMHLAQPQALQQISEILAARPAGTWARLTTLARDVGCREVDAKRALLDAVDRWTDQPEKAAELARREQTRQLRERMQQAPQEQWIIWARRTNPLLLQSEHWPTIAKQLHLLGTTVGVDPATLIPQLQTSPPELALALLIDFTEPRQNPPPHRTVGAPDTMTARRRWRAHQPGPAAPVR